MGTTQECLEQILEVAPHKTSAAHPPAFYLTNHTRETRHAGHCWRSKDELISDVFLWTPAHGCASVG